MIWEVFGNRDLAASSAWFLRPDGGDVAAEGLGQTFWVKGGDPCGRKIKIITGRLKSVSRGGKSDGRHKRRAVIWMFVFPHIAKMSDIFVGPNKKEDAEKKDCG